MKEYQKIGIRVVYFKEQDIIMDSAGIGMLIGRYKTMAERGGCVFARGMRPAVRRVFYMAGLHRIIEEQEPEGGGEK